MHILLVDDDPTFRSILHDLLVEVGETDISEASSGRIALERAKRPERAPDCIFLDMRMPGMDGLAVCARLRRMAHLAHAPIVMTTSAQDKDDINAAFAAGATDYLFKPVDRGELLDRLRCARRELGLGGEAQSGDSTEPPASLTLDALGNYFRALSQRRLLTTPVFACRAAAPETDLARAAARALVVHYPLVATAGDGIILCALTRPAGFHPARARDALDAELARTGRPTPVVIGPVLHHDSFNDTRPTRILMRAVSALSETGGRHSPCRDAGSANAPKSAAR